MNKAPRLSVLMSTHSRNRPGWGHPSMLRRAIDSVLTQSMQNFEFIIIDDASTDGTREVLEEYATVDSRIRIIRLFENCKGYTASRYNRLFAEARAPYVHTMFDDDEMLPGAYDCLLSATSQNDSPAIVYGRNIWRSVVEASSFDGKVFGSAWSEGIEQRNIFCQQAAIISVAALERVGLFDHDPLLARLIDWDVTLRMYEANLHIVDIPNVCCRVYLFNEDSIGANIPVDFGKFHERRKSVADLPSLAKLRAEKVSVAFVMDYVNDCLADWNYRFLAKELSRLGHTTSEVVSFGKSVLGRVQDADFVIYYRTTNVAPGEIESLQEAGKLVGYSIDDAIWMKNRFHFREVEAQRIKHIAGLCDFLVFPNESIAAAFPSEKPKLIRRHFIPAGLIPTRVAQLNRAQRRYRILAPKQGILPEISEMLLQIQSLLAQHDIELHYFSPKPLSLQTARHPLLFRHGEQSSLGGFWNRVFHIAPDVIINPLPMDAFIDCKTEVKFLEAQKFGVPLISSPNKPHVMAIGAGEERGLLASTPEEFVAKILALRDRPSLAQRIVENASARVDALHTGSHIALEFVANLEVLANKNKKALGVAVRQNRLAIAPAYGIKSVASDDVSVCPNLFSIPTESLLYPITFGRFFEQRIPRDVTCRTIQVCGHLYRARLSQPVRCDVLRGGGILITGFIEAKHAQDGMWWPVTFDRPLSLMEGDLIRFTNQDKRPISFFYSDYGTRKEAAAMRFI